MVRATARRCQAVESRQKLNKKGKLGVEHQNSTVHSSRRVILGMKTEKLSKVRFEKNVIAGAVIGSWGWNTPGAGCEVQAPSSKNTAKQDVKNPQKKNESALQD